MIINSNRLWQQLYWHSSVSLSLMSGSLFYIDSRCLHKVEYTSSWRERLTTQINSEDLSVQTLWKWCQCGVMSKSIHDTQSCVILYRDTVSATATLIMLSNSIPNYTSFAPRAEKTWLVQSIRIIHSVSYSVDGGMVVITRLIAARYRVAILIYRITERR